jgi:hypothetical protein
MVTLPPFDKKYREKPCPVPLAVIPGREISARFFKHLAKGRDWQIQNLSHFCEIMHNKDCELFHK